MSVQPKTILITGASSGFGLRAAKRLLSRGHRVVAAVRGGKARLGDLLGDELKIHGDRLLALDLHLDQADAPAQAGAFVALECGGKLDVLINNAGYGLFGAVLDLSDAQIRRQMEVNFFAPIALTRALLPALQAARGRVINISSIAGFYTFPSYGIYAASKHALEASTEGLYYDLKPLGVQVSLIEPGGFRTEFTKRSREYAAGPVGGKRTEALVNFFGKAESGLGDPERVAKLMVRLCEKNRIPLRSPIGIDARMLSLLHWLVPGRLIVALQDFLFRKVVYKS